MILAAVVVLGSAASGSAALADFIRVAQIWLPPRAWIVRTALNLRVSWWRRRRHEVELDDGAEAATGDSEPTCRPDPGLLKVLRGLPQRQREVVAFRVFLDLDTAATAKALDMAPGTITAHPSRAVATHPGAKASGTGLTQQRPLSRAPHRATETAGRPSWGRPAPSACPAASWPVPAGST
jgi:hypothetical protein